MDLERLEREYNNRAHVPEHPAFFARWERDSAFVRKTLAGHTDLSYGPDPRHRLDIFPAARPRATLVFIHGGYWRSLDKDLFSWLAAPFVAAGIGVAMPRYRLLPHVAIEDIASDALEAVNWLFAHGAEHGLAMERVVLSGHSAGAHLAASIFAAPRERLRFDPARIAGGLAVSGIYEFAPLSRLAMNADFGLDEDSVARLDLAGRARSIPAPILVAAGAAETAEFQRQSRVLADAWSPQARPLLLLPGHHHYSVLDALAERSQPLHEAVLRFVPSGGL